MKDSADVEDRRRGAREEGGEVCEEEEWTMQRKPGRGTYARYRPGARLRCGSLGAAGSNRQGGEYSYGSPLTTARTLSSEVPFWYPGHRCWNRALAPPVGHSCNFNPLYSIRCALFVSKQRTDICFSEPKSFHVSLVGETAR
jgi:hypothetical protein